MGDGQVVIPLLSNMLLHISRVNRLLRLQRSLGYQVRPIVLLVFPIRAQINMHYDPIVTLDWFCFFLQAQDPNISQSGALPPCSSALVEDLDPLGIMRLLPNRRYGLSTSGGVGRPHRMAKFLREHNSSSLAFYQPPQSTTLIMSSHSNNIENQIQEDVDQHV